MTLVERDSLLPPALASPGPSTLFDPYEAIARKARPNWRKATIVGYAVILIFFGGFGGFAAFAPLHSAVLAHGEMQVDTGRNGRKRAGKDKGVYVSVDVGCRDYHKKKKN